MWNRLPEETLLHVFSYLEPSQLCTVSKVNHAWSNLSNDNSLWAVWLQSQFLETEIEEEEGCKQKFKEMYDTWREYLPCYTKVKGVWNNLETWLAAHSPKVLADLNPRATETEFTNFVQKLATEKPDISGCPLELRCSLRIHDGQKSTSFNKYGGLLGGCEVYDYSVNSRLLGSSLITRFMSILSNRSNEQFPAWVDNCIPVAGSQHLYAIHFMVVRDFTYKKQSFKAGMIVNHTQHFKYPVFEASSFCEWLEDYANDLWRGKYDVAQNGEIIRFSSLLEDGSDVTTHGVRVRASAQFLPPRSTFEPSGLGTFSSEQGTHPQPTFFYAYRIKISMDASEPQSSTCKLSSRFWVITDEKGMKQEVSGPGVIGEYPLIRPGSHFEYCSCCPMGTPTGTMRGYFQFRVSETQELVNVTVGEFPLKPY